MEDDFFEVYTWPRLRATERVACFPALSTDPVYYQLAALAGKDLLCRVLLNPLARMKVRAQTCGLQGAVVLRPAMQHLRGLSLYALHSMAYTSLHLLFLRTFIVSTLHNDYPASPVSWARKLFLASAATAFFVETVTYPLQKLRNCVYAATPGTRGVFARIYTQAGLRGFYHCLSLALGMQLLGCFAFSALLCFLHFGCGLGTRSSVFLSTTLAGAALFPLDTLCKLAQTQRASVPPSAHLRTALAACAQGGWRRLYSGLPHFIALNALTHCLIAHNFKLLHFSRLTME